MMISLIAAMADDRVIGQGNRMPWHLPADLRHFKRLTLGKPIIMGRQTYLSLGKALPQRQNIILTRDLQFQAQGCDIAHHWAQALDLCAKAEEVMVIGGADIYAQALEFADRLYLTRIDLKIAGDRFFPLFNPADWDLVSTELGQKDDENPYEHRFLEYRRLAKLS